MKRGIHREQTRPAPRRDAGFTLVETALALLVISVGMMALFAIFPTGIDTARRINEETVAAQFAAHVFATLRADSVDAGNSFAGSSSRSLDGTVSTVCTSGNFKPTSSQQTVKYAYKSAASGSTEYALRYKLTVNSTVQGYTYGATRGLAVMLYVWPGEFGGTDTKQAIAFYTELYDYGL